MNKTSEISPKEDSTKPVRKGSENNLRQKNNPVISTVFKDTESNIDNWIKVETIPNGTETTFSDTRLRNIITHYAPNFNPKTYNVPLFQSAMYKSPLENFHDFYNQVFEKENNVKQKGEKLKKSYFEYNDDNVYVRIPHDTIVHVEKDHNLLLLNGNSS